MQQIKKAQLESRIYIRQPTPHDQREFIRLVRASQTLHGLWVNAPASPVQFRAYLTRMIEPDNVAHLICRRDNDHIFGVVNVTNIVLGSFRSAYLGYYAFAGHEGQGFMREGLAAVIHHAFRTLKLHRLEANIQPTNKKSLGLVKACGFVKEGYSPRYLKIAGRWRDHERWAIIAS